MALLLKFTKDSDGQHLMTGRIQAELYFTCQRCGEPVKIELNIQPKLSLVISESQSLSCPKEW